VPLEVVGILREDNIQEFANQKLLVGVDKVFKRGKFANSVVTGTGSLRRNLLCWTCEKLGKRALLKMLLHAVRRDAFHGRIRYPDLYRWFDVSFFCVGRG
jgi:hypothetical protein